jgi:hypothetical protein
LKNWTWRRAHHLTIGKNCILVQSASQPWGLGQQVKCQNTEVWWAEYKMCQARVSTWWWVVMQLTSTICPVEISMLVRAGSSLLWTVINSTFMIKPCQSQASSVL